MHFEFTERVKELQKRLTAFMEEHVYPNEARYHEHTNGPDRWQPVPVIEELKPKARAAGLWNLFLPESEHGAGLTNLEYAPLCEIMGRSAMAPEVFNCSAPDTGEYGGAGALRLARIEGALAAAAAGGRDPVLLRDDRAPGGFVGRYQHRSGHPARRRGICPERSQVVDLRRRRPAVQGRNFHG